MLDNEEDKAQCNFMRDLLQETCSKEPETDSPNRRRLYNKHKKSLAKKEKDLIPNIRPKNIKLFYTNKHSIDKL